MDITIYSPSSHIFWQEGGIEIFVKVVFYGIVWGLLAAFYSRFQNKFITKHFYWFVNCSFLIVLFLLIKIQIFNIISNIFSAIF